MKCYLLLFLSLLMLSSCGSSSATHDAVVDLKDSISNLDNSLPVECKTEATAKTIADLNAKADRIDKYCETEKASIRSDKVKWELAFMIMFALYLFSLVRKTI